MKSLNLRIEYIYHSGFLVESDSKIYVFDYFQGPVQLKKAKPVYVFSSHAHADHFNPLIFDWQEERTNINYILSSDIHPQINSNKVKDNITFISPYEQKQMADTQVKAYGSTDLGVSFLVRDGDVNIFHAGDLNWWYWWNDSSDEIIKAEKNFKEEIAKIKGEQIDVAFFPVDPRLEHNYYLGAEFFIQEVKPKILIPMHFSSDVKAVKKFAGQMENYPTKIVTLTLPGQEVHLN